MKDNAQVLIAGIGKLGIPLGLCLNQRGISVTGIRRDTDSVPSAITAVCADLSDINSLAGIKKQWDVVVYTVAASAFYEAAYHQAYVENLQNLLDVLDLAATQRVIFVSSSAVYGQCDGSWVNEGSVTQPQHFNGKVMLQAERIVLQTGIGTAVRFSGIYGAQRTRLLDQVRRGVVQPLEPLIYSNRIHQDDCVGVLDFLVERALRKVHLDEVYIGSDCEPAPLAEVQRWLAQQLNMDVSQLTQQIAERRSGSKRLSNQRIRDLGYQFIYPNYRDGYSAALSAKMQV